MRNYNEKSIGESMADGAVEGRDALKKKQQPGVAPAKTPGPVYEDAYNQALADMANPPYAQDNWKKWGMR